MCVSCEGERASLAVSTWSYDRVSASSWNPSGVELQGAKNSVLRQGVVGATKGGGEGLSERGDERLGSFQQCT